jgi:hypothetical protein
MCGEEGSGIRGRRGPMNQRFLLFAPVRFVTEFDFADAIDDRVPKFA